MPDFNLPTKLDRLEIPYTMVRGDPHIDGRRVYVIIDTAIPDDGWKGRTPVTFRRTGMTAGSLSYAAYYDLHRLEWVELPDPWKGPRWPYPELVKRIAEDLNNRYKSV